MLQSFIHSKLSLLPCNCDTPNKPFGETTCMYEKSLVISLSFDHQGVYGSSRKLGTPSFLDYQSIHFDLFMTL